MRRKVARRLAAVLTATAVAATGLALSILPASAATGSATGFATQNGGTTGGEGGDTVSASTGTEIHEALCSRASSSTPIIIEVSGTINHGNTSKVSGDSCNTADDVIEIKEVSNVTIVGVGGGAVFDQIGIHLRESSNIIIQNVTVRNVKKSGSPTSNGGDAIGMESNVSNVWADHLTLEASGGEDEGYDALFDMKNNTEYVTLSYSILRNSGRGGLVGSSDSDTGNGPVTYHHNLYQNIDSRAPLLRAGTAHSYNNHFVGIVKSGINSRLGAEIQVDNNYFEDSKDVLGTFYTDEMGSWEVNGNIYDNVTWSSDGSDNHPAGPNPQSTTSVNIPYSFDLDDAGCVPDVVSQTAGANKGNQVSDGNCSAEPPTDDPTTDPDDPTTDPTDPPTGRFEAEDSSATCEGTIDSNHSGFSGSGFCNTDNATGSAAQFTIDADAGDATLDIRYANGAADNRAADIVVNGSVVHSDVAFEPTGAWNSWSTVTVTAPVNSGDNTVRLVATTGGGLANIDFLDVDVAGADPDPDPTTSSPPPSGDNLSIGAGADGSSKAGGTSYGNVIDGDMGSYWSPTGSTGRISVKWGSDVTLSSINIREASGAEGNIGSWQVVDHDTGEVLATGSGAGVITFSAHTLSKINFVITSSNGTPQVAEFETFAG
ncbi:pectate lyase family protein [Glycomyces salinus]|uniref:pectate lyase family protein n=1 Tax=Glycomyces salinus TaxID=980294 RepID=UPI0018EC77D7|nr:carbohydrate-binding protein [Glycomyces salinus]